MIRTCHQVPSNRLYPYFYPASVEAKRGEGEGYRSQEGKKRAKREETGKDETAKEEGPELQSKRSRGKRKGGRERIKGAA